MKRGVGIALLLFVIIIMIGGAAVFLLSEDTAATSSPGKIIFVDDDFVDDPPNHKWNTLQEGIDDAEHGDTIAVFEGTYDSVDIYKDNITISGEATGSVTITDNATYAVKVIASGVTIQNLTIRGGYDAALYTEYDFLTVRNCRVTQDNPKSDSWAVDIRGSNASISGCTITSAGWGLRFMETARCSLRDTSFTSIENKSIVVDGCANISIDNVTASDVFCGLRLVDTTTTHVTDSAFTDGKVGLILDAGATGNSIRNCTVTGNAGVSTDFGYGIYLNASSNNTIASCQIQGNDRGIYAEATSHGNLIHHNNFVANGINAVDHGGNRWNSSIGNYWDTYTGSDTDHDGIGDRPYILPGNSSQDSHPLIARIQTPPARVWVDSDYNPAKPGWNHDHFDTIQAAIDAVVPGGGCYVYNGSYQPCIVDKNISLVGAGSAHVWGTAEGILVTANNAHVSGFTVTASNAAIKVQNARWVTIANCSATQAVFGVYLVNANECQLHGLSVHDNQKGIFLFGTVASTIQSCHVYDNTFFGLELSHVSAGNTIASCHIADNGNYGAYLVQNSTDNRFWHNNFIGNTAYDACVDNQWGGAYDEALGNYWSAHQGADGFKGANQSRPGRDGFVDTAYVVPGGAEATDLYPLRYPVDDPPFFAWVSPDFTPSIPGWEHDHYRSIQMALDALRDHGGCYVYTGTYQEQVALDRGLTVTGQSPDEVIVQGGDASGFTVTGNGAVLHQFTVQGCWNDPAVYVSGDNVSIYDCVFADSYTGLMVTGDNVSVDGSEAGYNAYAGAVWQHARHPVMENCSVYGNNKGVMLDDVHGGLFAHVEVHNNSVYALELSDASNNTIHHVSCVDSMYGAYVDDSSGNLFYFNDFIDNENQVWDNRYNRWDNSTVGNYWSDYTGRDNNHDGVGDVPYDIPGTKYADTLQEIFQYASMQPIVSSQHPRIIDNIGDSDTYKLSSSNNKSALICVSTNDFYSPPPPVYNVDGFPAQGLQAYYTLKAKGYTDENITFLLWHNNQTNVSIYGDHNDLLGPPTQIGGPNEPPEIDYNHSSIDKELLKQQFKNIASETDNETDVVLYLVDHGTEDAFELETNESISPGEMQTWLSWITANCSRVTFLSDFCYSGTFNAQVNSPAASNVIFISAAGDCPAWYSINATNQTGWAGSLFFHPFFEKINHPGNRDNHPLIRRAGLPVPSFTMAPSPTFTMTQVSFTDTSIDLDGVIVQRHWTFGDGTNVTTANETVTHVYTDNGTDNNEYTVTLTVTDDDNETGSVTKNITIFNTAPTANMTWIPLEPTDVDDIMFNGSGSSDPDGSIVNYTWSFGDNTTGYGRNVTHRYADNGVYTVTLTVTDDDGATDTMSISLPVGNMPPSPVIDVLPAEPTTADLVVFNGSGSSDPDGSIVNYTWMFGDNTTGYGNMAVHRYRDNGTYTATLMVRDDDNDTATASRNITVANVPPRANYTYKPPSPSDVDVVEFTDTSSDPDGSITAWRWEFGDGATSTAQNPRHTFPDNGIYTVNLTVTDDDGATGTISRSIEVSNVPPRSRFGYQPGEPTVIDTVAFIDDASDPDGSITAWQWDFGDGNTSTGRDATYSYKNDGLYTVTLTVTDNDGATGTHSMPLLVVNMPPIVNFTIAPGQPSDLDNISFNGNATDPDGEVTNYTWSYGDGNTSYGRNTTHRYTDNGTYTVTLTATDNDGRSNSHSRAISVANVPPTASFTYEPDDPSTGTYISFRDTSSDPDGTIVNATWHYGDGTTEQDGDLLNHKYDSAGTYQVKLVVRDNDGATANVTRTIEVEEEDEATGFEFVILIAAIGSLLVMWKRRMGVWRRR